MKSNQSGLTLVEIMIVLVILSIVLATLGSKIFGAGDKAKRQITEMKATQLKSYIDQYQLRYNALPGSLEDLARCNEKTGAGCVPIANKDEMSDAWNNPFSYQLAGNNRGFIIKSLGADGKDGGEGVDYDYELKGP